MKSHVSHRSEDYQDLPKRVSESITSCMSKQRPLLAVAIHHRYNMALMIVEVVVALPQNSTAIGINSRWLTCFMLASITPI